MESSSASASTSLKLTLSEPDKLSFFYSFLVKERNHENLLFWLKIEEFRRLAKGNTSVEFLREEAKSIVETHVLPSSTECVNMSAEIVRNIEEQMGEECPPFETLFAKAQKEIFKVAFFHLSKLTPRKVMLLDPFPRFVEQYCYSLVLLKGMHNQLFQALQQEALSDKFRHRKKVHGVEICRRKHGNSFCFMGITEMSAPPQEILEYVDTIENRRTWDLLLKSWTVLETFGDDIKVYHLKYCSPYSIMKDRDFVVMSVKKREDDKRCFFDFQVISLIQIHVDGLLHSSPKNATTGSSEFHLCNQLLSQKGYIRGKIEIAGFIIEPASHEHTRSKVTYLVV